MEVAPQIRVSLPPTTVGSAVETGVDPTSPKIRTRHFDDGKEPFVIPQDVLSSLQVRSLQPGDVIIEEGSEGRSLFIILKGSVAVVRKGSGDSADESELFHTLHEGSVFGELAVFYSIQRVASVVANERCLIGIVTKEDWNDRWEKRFPDWCQGVRETAEKRLEDHRSWERKEKDARGQTEIRRGSLDHSVRDDLSESSSRVTLASINSIEPFSRLTENHVTTLTSYYMSTERSSGSESRDVLLLYLHSGALSSPRVEPDTNVFFNDRYWRLGDDPTIVVATPDENLATFSTLSSFEFNKFYSENPAVQTAVDLPKTWSGTKRLRKVINDSPADPSRVKSILPAVAARNERRRLSVAVWADPALLAVASRVQSKAASAQATADTLLSSALPEDGGIQDSVFAKSAPSQSAEKKRNRRSSSFYALPAYSRPKPQPQSPALRPERDSMPLSPPYPAPAEDLPAGEASPTSLLAEQMKRSLDLKSPEDQGLEDGLPRIIQFLECGRCRKLLLFNLTRDDALRLRMLNRSVRGLVDKSLASVDLSSDRQNTDDRALIDLSLGKGLILVHELNLRNCWDLTDDSISEALPRFPNLRCLNLFGLWKLSDRSFALRRLHLQHLAKLDLSSLRKVTDKGLGAILDASPSLQELELSYCKSITDDVLESHLDRWANLRRLGLQRCTGLSTKGFQAWRNHAGAFKLESIALDDGVSLSDEVPTVLCGKCPNLRHLSVAFCLQMSCWTISGNSLQNLNLHGCRVTDDIAMRMAEKCPNVTHLSLRGCAAITMDGVEFILRCAKKLVHLNVTGCPKVFPVAPPSKRRRSGEPASPESFVPRMEEWVDVSEEEDGDTRSVQVLWPG